LLGITESVFAVRVRSVGHGITRVHVVIRLVYLVLTRVQLEEPFGITRRLAWWRVVGQWSTGWWWYRVTGTHVLRVRVGLLCSVVGNVRCLRITARINSLTRVRRRGARLARVTVWTFNTNIFKFNI
jgi:hypothetical protein